MNYVPGFIGLKITNVSSWTKCINIIRKYTKASIGEIKSAIENEEFILSSKTINISGIKKIKNCYDELSKNGIYVDIYEHYDTDELITRQLLLNLIESHDITSCEVKNEIKVEVDN